MRTLTTLLIAAVLFVSCSKKESASIEEIIASNDLETMRKKKAELEVKQQETTAQIEVLNKKIFELDDNKKIPLITTLTSKEQVFKHYLELQGNVKTKQNVLVYPEVPGILKEVFVKEGDKVTKGQIIAKIDDGGVAQQLAQMKASAELSKTTFERQKRLWDQKIGSEIQYLQAKTNYLTQKNAVEQMEIQLEKSNVIAPFDGVIDDVIKEAGTVIAPGQGSEIFRVVNLGNMYIETDVPETYVSSVKKGVDVEVFFPILNKKMNAVIKQAGNFINPANRTFKIQVDVNNSNGSIKPNLTSKLKINDYTNQKAIVIPLSIISENANGDQYVYVVEKIQKSGDKTQGTAKKVFIITGKTQGDVVEVLKGLSNGSKVVGEGARSVKDGQLVTISK